MSGKSKQQLQRNQPGQLQHVSVKSEAWVGPLPPPAVIQAFADIYPDAAKIIFESFQKEGDNRRANEASLIANQRYELETQRIAVVSDSRRQTLAAITALLTLTGFIGGGFYLLYIGKSIEGWTSLASAAALIIWGKIKK